jgi:integrase
MATVTYLLQSTSNPANIYVRLSIDRKNVFKRKTGYVINPGYWSNEIGLPNQKEVESKQLRIDLKKLSTEIESRLNTATSSGEEITGDWLQLQIDSITGKQKKTDEDRLTNYIRTYINNLQFKERANGKQGAARGTNQKYTTLFHKVEDFEKFKKKHYYVKDVDTKFRTEFLTFLKDVDKLNNNSAGRYIIFLKTVCNDAKNNGIETNPQLKQVKGFKEEALKVFLSVEELEKIDNTPFVRLALENAKNWLIIGCYIGQRVSDLLKMTKSNIVKRGEVELIELKQVKTNKRVSIPVLPEVKKILNRNNGEFPANISAQKFNNHLKDLCKLAGLNEPTEGAILVDLDEGNETIKKENHKWRKQFGTFPKHELITSHVCRRSFATNFYGNMPTPLVMSITGHSTERQFLEYIGKSEGDSALQFLEYYMKQVQMNKKEPRLTVLSKAQ